MPLVSVLLPVHNASATLGAALDSLLAGPLHDHERVIFWVAGQMGRCLAKHLQRAGAQVAAFLHVNPQKYGTQLHGAPVLPATILRAARSQPAAADSGGCSCGRPARHYSQPVGGLELARDN